MSPRPSSPRPPSPRPSSTSRRPHVSPWPSLMKTSKNWLGTTSQSWRVSGREAAAPSQSFRRRPLSWVWSWDSFLWEWIGCCEGKGVDQGALDCKFRFNIYDNLWYSWFHWHIFSRLNVHGLTPTRWTAGIEISARELILVFISILI